MSLRIGLLAAWLLLLAAPLGVWWWRGRHRVDVFASLPVPAALVDSAGRVRRRRPGFPDGDLDPDSVPAPGQVGRALAGDATPLALRGVAGGALAVSVEADPGLARRHRGLATLVPLLQHEVRAGLQGVLGHLSLLEEDAGGETARRALATARREAGRLIELVDGAQVLARLGAKPPTRTVLPAATIVTEALAGLDGAVSAGPVDLGVLVEVSDWQLIRALRNLVDNALRHGRPPVRVEVVAEAATVAFLVRDGGAGLDAERLARLCVPFARGETAAPGTGLGLTVVSEVLAGHGSALQALPGGVGFHLPRFRL